MTLNMLRKVQLNGLNIKHLRTLFKYLMKKMQDLPTIQKINLNVSSVPFAPFYGLDSIAHNLLLALLNLNPNFKFVSR